MVAIHFNVANIVGSGPVPAGTVEILDGATVICGAVPLDGSGNGSCNYAFATSGMHTLTASFTPTSPDSFKASTNTATHAVTAVVTRKSVGVYDGWVLEKGEFANVGLSMNSTNSTFILGDDGANRQFRSILSFNTMLPSGAIVTKITLKIKQSGAPVGTNPFSALGNIAVDLKKGDFGWLGLEARDFSALATKTAAMTIRNAPVNGWYSATLGPTANVLLNKAGRTQLRLRFALDDNNNKAPNYLNFFSGNALAANQPQLIIEYYVP